MTNTKTNAHYLIRVQLQGMHPPIWRDVIVPATISLAWLNEVILEVMGWDDVHLHQFKNKRDYYAPAHYEDPPPGTRDEAKVALCDLLKKEKDRIGYEYDFGDGWEHRVTLKKIMAADNSDELRCIKAKGGDVIEDCGGTHGLMLLMELKKEVESGAADADRETYDFMDLDDCDFEKADLDFINDGLAEILDEASEGGGLHPEAEPPLSYPALGDFDHSFEEDDHEPDQGEDSDFLEFMNALSASLPESEEMDESEEAEETFPEPYSELTPDDCDEFKQTLQLAEQFRATQPWKTLYDSDIFAIEDPATKELDIISVLGGGNEVYALHVHRPPTGLAFWKQAFSGTHTMDPESVMKTANMLEVDFTNKADMEAPDLALYKHLSAATPPTGRHRWVRFRSYRPRCFPWFTKAADLKQLRRAMRLTMEYVKLVKASHDPQSFLHSKNPAPTLPWGLKVFRLTDATQPGQIENWQLEDISVDWDRCETPTPTYKPNDFELTRIATMPKQEDIWEIGTIYLPGGVMTAEGPIMPCFGAACSIQSGEIPPTPEITADTNISELQTLWQCLVANIDAQGYCPSEIRVITDEAFETLAPFAKQAGISLGLHSEFVMLDDLFKMLTLMQDPGSIS